MDRPVDSYRELKSLGNHVLQSLRDAMNAFARLDVNAALAVVREDELVDEEYETIQRQCITFIDPVFRLHYFRAADGDVSRLDQGLNPVAAQGVEVRRQHCIQALTGIGCINCQTEILVQLGRIFEGIVCHVTT